MKKKVEIKKWDRKKQFEFFSGFMNPYVSVTANINIHKLLDYSRKHKISFYGLMSYLIMKTLNGIEQFKYVLEKGRVYKYDSIGISFSVLDENKQLNFSRTIGSDVFEDFIKEFKEAKEEAEGNEKISYGYKQNKVYLTCVPWVNFTSLQNPVDGENIDSIPRVCWGKYYINNNRYNISVSIQVNHAFQDGYEIGLFFNSLQANICRFEEGK